MLSSFITEVCTPLGQWADTMDSIEDINDIRIVNTVSLEKAFGPSSVDKCII